MDSMRLDEDTMNRVLEPLQQLSKCDICPRSCKVNRLMGEKGYCKAGADFNISSICIHRGEEPAISGDKGICNIFFTHCNLQCIYCQNFQISSNKYSHENSRMRLQEVLDEIITILDTGINIVGFVSPSHYVPQVKAIIYGLRESGYNPDFVYNTNGYDRVETLAGLEDLIDIYLPDYKYTVPEIANAYSDAGNYPEVALKALKEMFRQKGSRLEVDDSGYATSGIIIRHLVLPGHVDNSLEVLRNIAFELSPRMHISLMSQYYPTHHVADHPVLGRTLRSEEYSRVVREMQELGMYNGWVQHLHSHENYRPDFEKPHPFE